MYRDKNIGKVATIGFFDGVHRGHQYLLCQLKNIAKEKNLESMVVTFLNHPREFFNKLDTVPLLTTNSEKREIINKLGINHCLILDFNKELSLMTSENFIIMLAEKHNVKILLVGYDHKFGSDRLNSFDQYVDFGIRHGVKVMRENAYLDGNIDVSSSKIRKALKCGDISLSNKYLARNYSILGQVIKGNQIGRTISYPTANIEVSTKKLIPKNGVYAVKVLIDSLSYSGMLNIGNRPTVGGKNITVEVHILDFSGDLYDKQIELVFYKYLRDEKKFDTKDELKHQLDQDKTNVESYFKDNNQLIINK